MDEKNKKTFDDIIKKHREIEVAQNSLQHKHKKNINLDEIQQTKIQKYVDFPKGYNCVESVECKGKGVVEELEDATVELQKKRNIFFDKYHATKERHQQMFETMKALAETKGL